jgi:hypothetical protein
MPPSVRVVSLEATPADGALAGSTASGAYVNVYVLAQTDAVAVKRALVEVASAGWVVRATDRVSEVTAESFASGSEGLTHYEQCLIDGLVMVMHTWRHEH